MLSYLYRLITDFRREHGLSPCLLYLNPTHYRALLAAAPGIAPEHLARFLALQIVVTAEVVHPHVAWYGPQRRAAGGG